MNVTLPGTSQMLLALYAYLLPLLLYAVWSTLALWDLGRREDLTAGKAWGWALAIYLLPFVGAAAYLLIGSRRIGARTRLMTLGGGAAIYVLALALGSTLGGLS